REARELATRSGDPHVLSQVLSSFGILRCLSGAVDEALDPLVESVQRADETEDEGLRVAVRYSLCFRQWFAGRLSECLSVTEQGLELVRADLNLGTDRMGFSPNLGFRFMKGTALCLMGRLHEGEAELDRVIELARASQQWFPLCTSHVYQVFRC